MTIGEKIRKLMENRYTQKEMVEEFKKRGFKLSQPNLSKMLYDDDKISIKVLRVFAKVFDVKIQSFFD